MLEITSASNSKCKYIKSLSRRKGRDEHGEYTVEGIKSVRDALRSGKEISALCVSGSFYENTRFDYPENTEIYKIADTIFEGLCDTKAPQGILAVIKIREDAFEPSLDKAYIYCDTVSDPGNLGTIIRTADAAGFGGVFFSHGCADIYAPKTVRASMGSFFNIRLMKDVSPEYLAACRDRGFTLYGGALSPDAVDYRSADMAKPTIIVIGNEANGISDEVLQICTPVKIPILGKAESLNAGAAAAVLMYELVRQRT